MKHKSDFDDDDWYCPKCKGTEQWFDRSITYDKNGKVEGMTYRCTYCEISTDDWVRRGQR